MSTKQNSKAFSEAVCAYCILAALAMFALLLMSSCYGPKKARKQVVRAQATYPAVLAQICADTYPVRVVDSTRTEYLPGQIVTKIDTVEADCPPDANGEVKTVRIPCPPSTNRVDTFVSVQFRQVENTAKIVALEAERDAAVADAASEKSRGDRLEKGRNTWRLIGLGSLALIAVAIVLKVKRILPF